MKETINKAIAVAKGKGEITRFWLDSAVAKANGISLEEHSKRYLDDFRQEITG